MRFRPKLSETERHNIDLAFRVQREIFYESSRQSGGDQSTKNVFAVCDRKGERSEALCARGNEVYYLVRSIEP
jgi:hypothetical protein